MTGVQTCALPIYGTNSDADSTKPLTVTIEDSLIHANAILYVIIGGVYYALSTSTNLASVGARTVSVSEGKAVYEIIKDPILVVQNQYKVTYQKDNATSGNAPTDSNSYSGTGTVSVLGNSGNLAITGYGFSGWCKTATTLGNTCSGTKYSQNDTF